MFYKSCIVRVLQTRPHQDSLNRSATATKNLLASDINLPTVAAFYELQLIMQRPIHSDRNPRSNFE